MEGAALAAHICGRHTPAALHRTAGVKDTAGNPLAADDSWSFTTAAAPDTTPPTVTSRSPAGGASGVALSTSVTAGFSELMDSATITGQTVTLAASASPATTIAATVSYDSLANRATLTPSSPLAPSTATVKGGTAGVKDTAGNPLAADDSWSFTTAAPPTRRRPR